MIHFVAKQSIKEYFRGSFAGLGNKMTLISF